MKNMTSMNPVKVLAQALLKSAGHQLLYEFVIGLLELRPHWCVGPAFIILSC